MESPWKGVEGSAAGTACGDRAERHRGADPTGEAPADTAPRWIDARTACDATRLMEARYGIREEGLF